MRKRWSNEEIDLLINGTNPPGRSKVSCDKKRMEIKKKLGTYNEDHIKEKYFINRKYLESFKGEIKTVLDVYSGGQSYWKQFEGIDVITNDIDPSFNTNFHEDSLRFLQILSKFNIKADIIDLDAFGSPWREFEYALLMSKKGLIMTFGDKRYSVFNKNSTLHKDRYGIEIYKIEDVIKFYIEEAKRLGYNLKVYYKESWKMTWRVWFKIEQIRD